MPVMKSVFPKGSSVQVFLLPVQQTDEPRKTKNEREDSLSSESFGPPLSELGSSRKHLFFVKDKLFIVIGFGCQFHTQIRKNSWEWEQFIIQFWREQRAPLNCEKKKKLEYLNKLIDNLCEVRTFDNMERFVVTSGSCRDLSTGSFHLFAFDFAAVRFAKSVLCSHHAFF